MTATAPHREITIENYTILVERPRKEAIIRSVIWTVYSTPRLNHCHQLRDIIDRPTADEAIAILKRQIGGDGPAPVRIRFGDEEETLPLEAWEPAFRHRFHQAAALPSR